MVKSPRAYLYLLQTLGQAIMIEEAFMVGKIQHVDFIRVPCTGTLGNFE